MEKIDKDDIMNHMREEEKKLLLLDICSRLPYDVNIIDGQYKEKGRLTGVEDLNDYSFNVYIYQDKEGFSTTLNIDEFKMYLRPMSNMTKEEMKEYYDGCYTTNINLFTIPNPQKTDWLNAHHFDYRCLIEKGSCY